MKKVVGYLISLLGIVGLALTIDSIKSFIPITLPEAITTMQLTAGSVVLIIVGVLLVLKSGHSSSKGSEEVPIYKNNKIVGYRRH